MPILRCPGCAAPFEPDRPDPLARCEWCHALLASADSEARLAAAPTVDAAAARSSVLAALPKDQAPWRPAEPLLVAYPFSADGTANRPLRPLAALPPALADSWRATGSDLAAGPGDSFGESAIRVTPTAPLPSGARQVLYPFWRVPLHRGTDETAAWCDAVDGQVLLPDELSGEAVSGTPDGGRPVSGFIPFAGLVLGLALPLPWSIAPFLLGLALVASGSAREERS